jgi:hypothetical protein
MALVIALDEFFGCVQIFSTERRLPSVASGSASIRP